LVNRRGRNLLNFFHLFLNRFLCSYWFCSSYWCFDRSNFRGSNRNLFLFNLNYCLLWGLNWLFRSYDILWSWLGNDLYLRLHGRNLLGSSWLWRRGLNNWLGNWNYLLFRDRSRCWLQRNWSRLWSSFRDCGRRCSL